MNQILHIISSRSPCRFSSSRRRISYSSTKLTRFKSWMIAKCWICPAVRLLRRNTPSKWWEEPRPTARRWQCSRMQLNNKFKCIKFPWIKAHRDKKLTFSWTNSSTWEWSNKTKWQMISRKWWATRQWHPKEARCHHHIRSRTPYKTKGWCSCSWTRTISRIANSIK